MAGSDAAYKNVDIPLDAVITDTQRRVVDGAEAGPTIYGVYVVPQNFVDPPLPAGAEVKLYFGANDEIILTDDIVSFAFECGHSDGIFFSNAVALANKKLRLLVDYSGGGMVQRAS